MTERERLIELIANTPPEVCTVTEMTDYLLDNGVIVLPCRIGDILYWIENPAYNGAFIERGMVQAVT